MYGLSRLGELEKKAARIAEATARSGGGSSESSATDFQFQDPNPLYPSLESAQKFSSLHESLLVLSAFARLALEPKHKRLFFGPPLLAYSKRPPEFVAGKLVQLLLCAAATGAVPEAREALSVLANLLYHGDAMEEKLICWFKFDGAAVVDSANVLQPIPAGGGRMHPLGLGRGLYHSSCWGREFLVGSAVLFGRNGLDVDCDRVPGRWSYLCGWGLFLSWCSSQRGPPSVMRFLSSSRPVRR